MKKIMLIPLLMIVFATMVLPQTSAFITNKTEFLKNSANDPDNTAYGWVKTMTFTIDSATALASPAFELGSFNGIDFYTVPIAFHVETPYRFGGLTASLVDIFLQAYDGTDTTSIDTIKHHIIVTASDSVGYLQLNLKRSRYYKIFIRSGTNDMGTSTTPCRLTLSAWKRD